MRQTHLQTVTAYGKSRESEGRHQAGFWLFVLMLCLLPTEHLDLPYRLSAADSALVLLTLYGLARAWRSQQRLDFPLLLPMWLILLSSLVATLTGFGDPRSIVAIIQEIYLFTWFIVLTNILRTFPSADVDHLMTVWSVVASAEAVIVLAEMLRVGSRAEGTFRNANATGAYLSVSIFVLLATRWPGWLRSVLGVWLFAGMYATGSMGALFSTIAGLLALLVVRIITRYPRATWLQGAVLCIGASLFVALLFILWSWPSMPSEAQFDEHGGLLALTVGRFPRSMASRFNLISRVWPVYRLHPWGTGPNVGARLRISLHNDYVAFLFERGPVGALGWLWLVGASMLAPLRAVRQCRDSHQAWQVLALGAGFLACALNALTHEVSHFRQVWALMVFLFAGSCACSVRSITDFSAGAESVDRRALV
jgi:hypothetical protein